MIPLLLPLKGAAGMGLGRRMGAVSYNYDARSENLSKGPGQDDEEFVYYDSLTAERNCCGRLLHLDCCLPAVFKITSERVLHVEWDTWHPW
jgi:hypothetical protein